ncbi:hypothetical protein JCM3775_002529 [Rhodotorula graminis]
MPPTTTATATATAAGTLLVGLVASVWLSSSATHFAAGYLRRTGDSGGARAGVIFFTALSSAHTGVWCYATYGYVVDEGGGGGDSEAQSGFETSWVLTAHLAILVTLSTVAQAYFAAARLSTLYSGRRRAALVGSVALLSCAQLGFGITATYYSVRAPGPDGGLFAVELASAYGWTGLARAVAAVLGNTIIALALVADMRSSSGRFAARDENLGEVCVRLVFESNAATAVVSVLACALYVAWTARGGVALALSIVLPNLYLLSVLASLERGKDHVMSGALSRTLKHTSSLSDMFKGVPLGPLRRATRTDAASGERAQGTPIADLYGAGGAAGGGGGGGGGRGGEGEEPGWLRRTFQPSPAADDHHHHSPPPLHSLAPPPAGFATNDDPLAALAPPPPPGQRPLTGISVSDYGAWLDDDERDGAPHVDSRGRRSSSSSSAYAGHAAAAGPGDAWASGVEQAAGTPTPRKSTFGLDAHELEGRERGAAGAGAGGGGAAAVAPVRYGYL